MQEKYSNIFKDSGNILAVFLFRAQKTGDPCVFYLFREDEMEPVKTVIFETGIRSVFREPFRIMVVEPKPAYQSIPERHRIFRDAELVYAASPQKVHEIIDSIIKLEAGLKKAKDVDLKVMRENDLLGRDLRDSIEKLKFFLLCSATSIVVFLVVYRYFGVKQAVLMVLVFLACFFGIYWYGRDKLSRLMGLLYLESGTTSKTRDHFSKSRRLRLKKQFAEALAELESASLISPDDPEPRVQLAETYEDMKDFARAAEEWEKVSVLERDKNLVSNALHRAGSLLVNEIKDPKKGGKILRRVCEKYPGTEGAARAEALLRQI